MAIPFEVFDRDYRIVYSGTFNVYEGQLILHEPGEYKFIFNFKDDSGTPRLEFKGDQEKKEVECNLFNFNDTLGMATTEKLHIITRHDQSKLYFSLFTKALSKENNFRQVTINFYVK